MVAGSVGVTVVLGVCAPERRRVAAALPADRLLDLSRETGERLLNGLREVAANDPTNRVVVLCESGVLPHDVVALFRAAGGPHGAALAAVITVVDAEHLLTDLTGHRSLRRPQADGGAEQPLASVAVDQIEHCDAVVVANWRRSGRESLGRVLTVLSHLNPAAPLTMFRPGRPWERRMGEVRRLRGQTAGWVNLLNDRFPPHMTGSGVTAFRYEQVRPLHAERLLLLLESGFEHLYGRLLRSAGLCRFASRPGVTGKWDHVGGVIAFQPLAADRPDEPASTGQDIAFIGMGLDRPGLTAALDDCALIDAELAAGPVAWTRYRDPLPTWEGALPEPGERP